MLQIYTKEKILNLNKNATNKLATTIYTWINAEIIEIKYVNVEYKNIY